MKTPRIILAIVTIAALTFAPGCANQTPAQRIATGQQIFNAALDGWAATNGGKTMTPQAVQEIGNNLFAIAAGTQASVGETPTAANIAQYSADPNIGSNVALLLPGVPITQAQADAAFAAAKMAATAKAPAVNSWSHRLGFWHWKTKAAK